MNLGALKPSVLLFASIIFMWACGPNLPTAVEERLAAIEASPDYNFDIKPILADRCFSCHGPDDDARKADLRLDLENEATAEAIVAGRPSRSALVDRILATDPDQMMPPPESKLALSDHEKALLIKWIDDGAEYKKHWSFIAPAKSEVPEGTHPIDHFIEVELNRHELSPSPPSSPARLLRRVYMDLTGLPPQPHAIDAFTSTQEPEAYEKTVDLLLSSPEHAERLALEWMDVARYADSHGLHADGWRSMWPWRDYVIKAFQQNMPYNQFVTEQLAGDLLPDPTRDQIVATAFHRNHPMTAEGGAIDEEFRLEYVADRTNTTATAILGLTMECAKCHDHKYDPISQEEYYQMSAFFNNVRELGMTGDDGNYGPILQLANEATQRRLAQIQHDLMELVEQRNAISASDKALVKPDLSLDLAIHLPMDRVGTKRIDDRTTTVIDGKPKVTSGAKPGSVPGRVDQAVKLEQEYDAIYLKGYGSYDSHHPFSASIWVNTHKRKSGTTQVIMGNAGDKNNFWRGWDFYLDDQGRINLRLINALPDNLLHAQSLDEVSLDEWAHIGFTYDGSSDGRGIRLFINGKLQKSQVLSNGLTKNIRTIGAGAQLEVARSLALGRSYRSFTGENGIYQGMLDELYLYDRILSELEMRLLFDPSHNPSKEELKAHSDHTHVKRANLNQQIQALVKDKASMHDTIPEIMIMKEMERPRPTFVLDRGQYNAPGRQVEPGTPKAILAYGEGLPENRLGLAQWLFDPSNPLTARVTVNRYWQMIFGRGLVKTANDFGVQGSIPSHPELLDWLAIYLVENDWDLRSLLKLIVTSKTYRQSSSVEEIHLEKDPDNIFLARSPSYRWPAELIRDNALAASGLLHKKIGGPSVKPYQPDGLWIDKGTFSFKLLRYKPDTGNDLYRRSLYTFVKRTSPHPAMTIFDAPNRDVCTITREITNTPLQALVLLNDPQFVECSRVLAQKVMLNQVDNVSQQITHAYQLLTGRVPLPAELSTLLDVFASQKKNFDSDKTAVNKLLEVGEYPVPDALSKPDLAAMTIVANTIMNSDESYTRR